MRRVLATLLSLLSTVALAKEPPSQVITWPDTGAPVLRFTFGKFKDVGSFGNQRTYVTETTAENIGSKSIGSANFSLYLFDKNKTRIGEAIMIISDLSPGGTVKFQTTVRSPGAPVSLSVVAKYLPKELGGASVPAKVISITVNTVPQGAVAKLDGVDAGITPKIVRVSVGKHILEFSKKDLARANSHLKLGRTMFPAEASASNSAPLPTTQSSCETAPS